jgi:hypothetical protein
MNKLYNSLPITGVVNTITRLIGLESLNYAASPIDIICDYANMYFHGNKIDRIFIYNPDAIAFWLYQKYTALFSNAVLNSQLLLPMLSVMPTVTPSCFASMYSGVMPEVHGIKSYIKPILKIDTIFDAYIRSGLKPAIVSTVNDSISCIFLDRDMDYFIYNTHTECNNKAIELIIEDKHDLIVLYNGNYDTEMHRTGTNSNESLYELEMNIQTFVTLITYIKKYWNKHRTMIGFCPDHGCHNIENNQGNHGLDITEDMNIIHFYRFI